MFTAFLAGVSSFALSLGLTPLVRWLAIARGVVDDVGSSRKLHRFPVPRLGGIAIVAGVYAACGIALLVSPTVPKEDGTRLTGLAVAGLAVAALGYYDDIRGAGAWQKFAVQFAAALLLYAVGFRIDVIANPLGGEILLGALSLPLTVLWIAGVSNAINLIDGLDGLAGGIAVAGAVAVLSVGAHAGDALVVVAAAALVGGILGFLVYNINPASIFMGDTGSLFLGAVLAALAIRPHQPGGRGVPLVAMIVVLAIPIVDTLAAMIRRAARGSPLFSADREHLHHRLLDLGFSPRQVVIGLWSAAAGLVAAGVHLACVSEHCTGTLVGVVAVAGLTVQWLGMVRMPHSTLRSRRRRNTERLAAIRRTIVALQSATDIGAIQTQLAMIASELGARTVLLRRAYAMSNRESAGAGAYTRFFLEPRHPERGALDVYWLEGRAVDRDAEIACETLSRSVAKVLSRLEREGRGAGTWLGRAWKDGEPGARSLPALHRERSSPGPAARTDSTEEILGYVTATGGLDACVASILRWIDRGMGCRWLACINPHSYVVAKKDELFRAALRGADWLIPDGAGIVLASRLLRKPVRERVTGGDVFSRLHEALDRRGGASVFFLGSTDETLALLRDRVRRDFPNVRVAGTYSPPFKTAYTPSELDEMIAAVNAAEPDVLWVGMTAPKQERWIHQNRRRLHVKFAAAVGAVFDFSSGRVKRSSPAFQRLGLEWLPRLLREPRRLWRRTFVSAPLFLFDAMRAAVAVRLGTSAPSARPATHHERMQRYAAARGVGEALALERTSPVGEALALERTSPVGGAPGLERTSRVVAAQHQPTSTPATARGAVDPTPPVDGASSAPT